MTSSFIGQEGQPLPLLAIKLSTVITNSDVTVPQVGLLSNRMDLHGKIYNRLRRLATATYTATQLGFVGFVVNFIGTTAEIQSPGSHLDLSGQSI